MDDEAAVAEEGVDAGLGGQVEVKIGGLEAGAGFGRHQAVLAAQVADLAGCGVRGFADGGFAADVGVEVGAGCGAVAVGGDGVYVDVVDCCLGREWVSGWLDRRGGIGLEL